MTCCLKTAKKIEYKNIPYQSQMCATPRQKRWLAKTTFGRTLKSVKARGTLPFTEWNRDLADQSQMCAKEQV